MVGRAAVGRAKHGPRASADYGVQFECGKTERRLTTKGSTAERYGGWADTWRVLDGVLVWDLLQLPVPYKCMVQVAGVDLVVGLTFLENWQALCLSAPRVCPARRYF